MPLLIVLVIVLIVLAGSRIIGRRKRSDGTTASPLAKAAERSERPGKSRDITREDAEEASARLDPETHRRVYSFIAQHQVLNAVKEYRQATRTGLREAAASVAALAQFPQQTPQQRNPQQQTSQQPTAQQSTPDAPLTVEDIIAAAATVESGQAVPRPVVVPTSYRYRAIVSRGDDVREVASTRLNEEVFTTITAMARSGNYDGAARILRDHADIGEKDAMEFVRMISPEA